MIDDSLSCGVLDRVSHHCEIIETGNESWRIKIKTINENYCLRWVNWGRRLVSQLSMLIEKASLRQRILFISRTEYPFQEHLRLMT